MVQMDAQKLVEERRNYAFGRLRGPSFVQVSRLFCFFQSYLSILPSIVFLLLRSLFSRTSYPNFDDGIMTI